jgi:DNA-binding NtrC family response regulator
MTTTTIHRLPFRCRDCGSGPLNPHRTTNPKPARLTHAARRLCAICYPRHQKAGTLAQFPRSLTRDEFELELQHLRKQGLTTAEIAHALGIRTASLYRRQYRYRHADARASPPAT